MPMDDKVLAQFSMQLRNSSKYQLAVSRLFAKYRDLVSWCFEPSQPQRITSGLNTNFILPPSYSFHKPWYQKSWVFSLFIFRGHSTREPAFSRVTYFILRLHREEKIGRGFGKNAGEWTGRVETSKGEIPGSKRSMYGYLLTYSRL